MVMVSWEQSWIPHLGTSVTCTTLHSLRHCAHVSAALDVRRKVKYHANNAIMDELTSPSWSHSASEICALPREIAHSAFLGAL